MAKKKKKIKKKVIRKKNKKRIIRKKKKVVRKKKIIRKVKVVRKKKAAPSKKIRRKKVVKRRPPKKPVAVREVYTPLVEQTAPYKLVLRDSRGKFVSSKAPSKAKIFTFYDKRTGKRIGSKYVFPSGLSASEKRTAIEAVEEQVSPKKPRKVYVAPPRKLQKTYSPLQIKEHTKLKTVYSPDLKDFINLKRKHLLLAKARPVDTGIEERELLKKTFVKHAKAFLKKTSDSKKLYILTLITRKKDGTEGGFSFPRSQVRHIQDLMDDFDRMMDEFEKKNKEYFKKGAFHQFNDEVKGLIIEATY